MSDDKAPPHCPRCGGELVHTHETEKWYVRCSGCDFHNIDDRDLPAYKDRAEALYAARRLIRAELARQALEMRANAHYVRPSKYDGSTISDWPAPQTVLSEVMLHYTSLGKDPIRLPGDPA